MPVGLRRCPVRLSSPLPVALWQLGHDGGMGIAAPSSVTQQPAPAGAEPQAAAAALGHCTGTDLHASGPAATACQSDRNFDDEQGRAADSESPRIVYLVLLIAY